MWCHEGPILDLDVSARQCKWGVIIVKEAMDLGPHKVCKRVRLIRTCGGRLSQD